MKKKVISALLCLALLALTSAPCLAAEAAETAAPAGAQQPVDSPDDFSWDNANVYFLMTDRFCNGDPSNDHSYGRTLDENGDPISGWDTCPTTFHGGDFAGVTQKIDDGYFDDLGVNAIWISAPYEQIHGYTDTGENGMSFSHYGYHGYYALDYTETDANFGTKQEFQTLVDTAHEHGIRVVLDVVLNHCGYANVKDMIDFNYGTFSNRAGAESYLYRINNVSGFNSCINYNATSSDWGRWWGSDWIRAGLPGYSTNNSSELTQCLASLPDFRTESTAPVNVPQFLQNKWQQEGTYIQKMAKYSNLGTVSDYLTTWIAEWVENYGVDGFRCDTAKHVELSSWIKLKNKCKAALNTWRENNPGAYGANWDEDFWMTGESWGHGLNKDSYYSAGFDSMINFSCQGNIAGISSLNSVYQNYANSINSDPNFNVLTYLSSHDTNLARGDLYYQGTSLMLLPGGVQIFYGDETNRGLVPNISFDGNGGSGHCLRSDMNWNTINQSVLEHWQKVGKFRSNHVAVGAGQHRQISAYNNSTGYTFSRTYNDGLTDDNVVCAVGAPAYTNLEIDVSSVFSNGTVVTDEYNDSTAVVQNGKAVFNSGPRGVILISEPKSSITMALRGSSSFYDNQTVTLSLRGADFAMVSINGGTAFRIVNGQSFEIGNGIAPGTTFNVTLTASNGEETLSKTFTYKKKDPNAVTRIYFDNAQYNWSNVNVYVYDETVNPVMENRTWPGEAMQFDNTTGYYVYEVPEELAVKGLAIFNNGSSQYPSSGATGLAINGSDKMLVNRTVWQTFVPPQPTYSINTDDNVNVYRMSGFEHVNVTSSAAGETLAIELKANANPGTGKYFTGEFLLDGTSLGSESGSGTTWYIDEFNMPEHSVTVSAVKANKETLSINLGSEPTELPAAAILQLSREVEMDYDETTDTTLLDLDNSGTPDAGLTVSFDMDGEKITAIHNYARLLDTADAPEGSYVYTFSENTDRYSQISFVTGNELLRGDVNLDGRIDVRDATMIQRHCASIITLTDNALAAADTDTNNSVTVTDATLIQKYAAHITVNGNHCGEVMPPVEEDPPYDPPSNRVTLNATGFQDSGAEFYAWTWNPNEDGHWVAPDSDSYGPAHIYFSDLSPMVTFVRMNPANNGHPDWSYKWNQTADLSTRYGGTFTITGWGLDGHW
ncbi:MAG: alpha-amylase family glycosyl hydrolase [Ruminococcus sp.]|nr:alpha-amylase family glycosyl hydrolase [Ruminococcus sp.]